MDSQSTSTDPAGLTLPGTVSLFGFASTEAEVRVLPRGPGWRRLRGGGYFLGGMVLAPALGMVPPHAPWALGALAVGTALGLRKWREHFTLLAFAGTCPKCGGRLTLGLGGAAKAEMSVPCEGCHHDSRLAIALPNPEERG
jgi:hypothetical protein